MGRLKELRKYVDAELNKMEDADKRTSAVAHLYGVSLAATMIAKKRGLDPEIASMAAMLHDLHAYKTGSYDDHAHKGAELARHILDELKLTDDAETDMICSAIYNHDDKLQTDAPMDEVLKDADVIHHCMNDLSKAVKEKEQARFDKLCKEFGMDRKMIATKRLILRRWEDSDAEDLYRYASDPDVGPIAGWPPHQSIEESLEVIRNVFSGKEAYAICLKEDGKAIGAIELKLYGSRGNDLATAEDECEIGYWLGKPFWGQGIVPEAVNEMLRRAFGDLGMNKVWAGYYDGNTKSKRVQEKCGFKYQWKSEGLDVPLMNEKRTGHVNLMTREDWRALHKE